MHIRTYVYAHVHVYMHVSMHVTVYETVYIYELRKARKNTASMRSLTQNPKSPNSKP